LIFNLSCDRGFFSIADAKVATFLKPASVLPKNFAFFLKIFSPDLQLSDFQTPPPSTPKAKKAHPSVRNGNKRAWGRSSGAHNHSRQRAQPFAAERVVARKGAWEFAYYI